MIKEELINRWVNVLTTEDLLDYYPQDKEKAIKELTEELPDLFDKYGENWDDPDNGPFEQRIIEPDEELQEILEELNKTLKYSQIIINEYIDPYGGFGSISICNAWLNH